jgi:hypothetical protein
MHFLIAFRREFIIFIQLALNGVQSMSAANFIEKGQHGRDASPSIDDQKIFATGATPREARWGTAHLGDNNI